MTTEAIDFDIMERPEFALLRVRLAGGQKLFAEPSAMASMDPSITLKAGLKGRGARQHGAHVGG